MSTNTLKLAEIARRIAAHLARIERTPKLNKNTKPDGSGLSDYWNTHAYQCGNRVRVQYISYQGSSTLTRADALAYLAWLDAGNAGRHWQALRPHIFQPAERAFVTPCDTT